MSTNLKKPSGKEKLQEFLLRRKQRELGLFCWGRTQADLLQKAGIPASLNSWGKKKPRGRQSSQQGVSPHATRFSEQCFFPVGWLLSVPMPPYPSGVHCHSTPTPKAQLCPQPHTKLSRDKGLATPSREAGSPVFFPQRQTVVKTEKCLMNWD